MIYKDKWIIKENPNGKGFVIENKNTGQKAGFGHIYETAEVAMKAIDKFADNPDYEK